MNLINDFTFTLLKKEYKERPYKFYKSSPYLTLKRAVIHAHNNMCVRCASLGRVRRATLIHHVLHVGDCYSLSLHSCNVVPLCNACHNMVHAEKRERIYKQDQQLNASDERWE